MLFGINPASANSKLPIPHNFTKRDPSEICNNKIEISPVVIMLNNTQ